MQNIKFEPFVFFRFLAENVHDGELELQMQRSIISALFENIKGKQRDSAGQKEVAAEAGKETVTDAGAETKHIAVDQGRATRRVMG
eukprot:g69312.t1